MTENVTHQELYLWSYAEEAAGCENGMKKWGDGVSAYPQVSQYRTEYAFFPVDLKSFGENILFNRKVWRYV